MDRTPLQGKIQGGAWAILANGAAPDGCAAAYL